MRGALLLPFLLGFVGCINEEAGLSSPTDICAQLCDGTYPEHTYPRPEDHLACGRGCRLTQVEALIAWPFQPNPFSCLDTCTEAYSTSPQEQNACKVGCNASTIDQMVPDRDEIYDTDVDSSSVQFMLLDSSILQLSRHAEKLFQFLPCSTNNASSIFIIEDTGQDSVKIQFTFGFDYVPLSSADQIFSDYMYIQEKPTSATLFYYYCPWKTVRYSVGIILLLTGLGLIMTSLFTCSFSSLLSEEKGRQEQLKVPNKHPLNEPVLSTTSLLSSPPAYSPGYPQPVPYYGKKTSLVV